MWQKLLTHFSQEMSKKSEIDDRHRLDCRKNNDIDVPVLAIGFDKRKDTEGDNQNDRNDYQRYAYCVFCHSKNEL